MARYGSAGTVKGDPHWITVRHAGSCAKCGAPIPVGSRAFYWPRTRSLHCAPCGDASERVFRAEVDDELMSGGWS